MSDTQINTWTAQDQVNPSVSSLSDGNFVVVWQSNLEDGCGWAIYGQFFYSNGAKKENEFLISNCSTLDKSSPNVAASSSGKFMVVWMQSDKNIFGQIFMNDGTKLSTQLQINTIIDQNLENPSIIALNNNNFIVTWDKWLEIIFAQIFTDNGTKVGQQLNIASSNSYLSSSKLTSLADGNFAVTYTISSNVYAEIFYHNGDTLVSQFLVHDGMNKDLLPSISSVSIGNFMIVWQSQFQDLINSADYGIYGQSFTSSAVKIGDVFRVNTYIIDDQINPSIKSIGNNNYIVTWQSNNQDESGWGIYGQILNSIGKKIGSEFRINSYTNSDQTSQSVSSLINTNFVVVWTSDNQDGSNHGIFGNIYQSDGSIVGFDTCPFNCQSCNNNTNCIACNYNFTFQKNGLCGCFDGFYLDISGYFCVSKLIN